MKKISVFLVILLVTNSLSAQVANKDQWTCNGTHENLYSQLNAGKTVLIAMQGLDCSGCIGNAPYIDTFASNNKAKLRVWSALQLMAGSGGTCTQVNDWVQVHGYNDVFTFLDSSNYWASTNPGAEFVVISPTDKKAKYVGLDMSKAFTEARKIFDPTSVNDISTQNAFKIYPNPTNDVFTIELKRISSVKIISIVGDLVMNKSFKKGSHEINIDHLASGVYIVNVIANNTHYQTRLIKQ